MRRLGRRVPVHMATHEQPGELVAIVESRNVAHARQDLPASQDPGYYAVAPTMPFPESNGYWSLTDFRHNAVCNVALAGGHAKAMKRHELLGPPPYPPIGSGIPLARALRARRDFGKLRWNVPRGDGRVDGCAGAFPRRTTAAIRKKSRAGSVPANFVGAPSLMARSRGLRRPRLLRRPNLSLRRRGYSRVNAT